jgi:hypothetical protein
MFRSKLSARSSWRNGDLYNYHFSLVLCNKKGKALHRGELCSAVAVGRLCATGAANLALAAPISPLNQLRNFNSEFLVFFPFLLLLHGLARPSLVLGSVVQRSAADLLLPSRALGRASDGGSFYYLARTSFRAVCYSIKKTTVLTCCVKNLFLIGSKGASLPNKN